MRKKLVISKEILSSWNLERICRNSFTIGSLFSFKDRLPFRARAHLATLFNHMWPRIVAGIFIPVGNNYFQALASTLQFVAQVGHRLWLVPATDRAFAYITYMSPPHVALVCSGPPQCAATCG